MPAPDQNFTFERIIDQGLTTGSTGTHWTVTVPTSREWQVVSWHTDEVGSSGNIQLEASPAGSDVWMKLEYSYSDKDLNIIAHLTEGDQLRLEQTTTGSGTWNSIVSYREYRSKAAAR